MSGFTVYQDSYVGSTIISNRFIDEYMTDANDAQIKIYLYLIRMVGANLETGVTDIADRFNHTETEVLRSLKYWEKKGLLKLEFDPEGKLAGVHLVNICKGDASLPAVESTHRRVPQSDHRDRGYQGKEYQSKEYQSKEYQGKEYPDDEYPDEEYQNHDEVNAGDVSVRIKERVEKPAEDVNAASQTGFKLVSNEIPAPRNSVSAREMADFGENGGRQLIFLAEMYFGRPITQKDIQTLIYVSSDLGFSDDLIDYLLQYCAEKGKKDFRYAEKVAIGWKEKGIENVEQARSAGRKYDRTVYEIMNRLGKSGSPTDKEMEYIVRWKSEYDFSDVVVFEACDRTVMATDSHRFQYAEGILANWKRQGIRTIEDIEKMDSSYRNSDAASGSGSESSGVRKGTARSNAKKNTAGSFGNYHQSDIDYDAISKKLFAN